MQLFCSASPPKAPGSPPGGGYRQVDLVQSRCRVLGKEIRADDTSAPVLIQEPSTTSPLCFPPGRALPPGPRGLPFIPAGGSREAVCSLAQVQRDKVKRQSHTARSQEATRASSPKDPKRLRRVARETARHGKGAQKGVPVSMGQPW